MYSKAIAHTFRLLLISFLATGIVACGETDGEEAETEESEGIEVAGDWDTQFDTIETIDEEMWSFMYLVEYNNDERWAVTQNPDDDEHNPDLYNRLEWTPIENDVFHYCTVDFGLDSREDALNSEASADADDLETGCGGFEWTEMSKLVPLES